MMASINSKIFKANDIRGEYPNEINEKIISEISRRLGQYFLLKAKSSKLKAKLVVAHDARLSSPSLYRAAIRSIKRQVSLRRQSYGASATSVKIIKVGMATTPMFYFLVKKLKASAGIMITASHNPQNYNGLKIVDENALPISGFTIKKLFNL